MFDGALAGPGAPPNLTSSVNGSTVTLTWLVPTSPDPATSYVIEAGSSAGSTNIAVFDTLSTATSFTATEVPLPAPAPRRTKSSSSWPAVIVQPRRYRPPH